MVGRETPVLADTINRLGDQDLQENMQKPAVKVPWRQSIVARLIFTLMASVYIGVLYAIEPSAYPTAILPALFAAYTLTAFIQWLQTRRIREWPLRHPLHKKLEILADATLLTTAMTLAGSSAVGLYVVYIWIIFLAGYLYGISAMAWATTCSIAGLFLTATMSPDWRLPLVASTGLIIGLPTTYALFRHSFRAQNKIESALAQYAAEWERLAAHDSLSGLPNRRRFTEEMRDRIRRAEGFVLILFDLDDFKLVNDTFGHPIGDSVLQTIARRASRHVRKGHDLLVRLGGDEFAILMEGTCQSTAQQMMERLHDSLSTPISLGRGTPITIRASIGMAVYPNTANTMTDLIAKADHAMYQDKNSCKPFKR